MFSSQQYSDTAYTNNTGTVTREEFLKRLESELKRVAKERKKKNAQALLMRPPPAPVPVQPASRAPVLLLRARGQAPRKPK